MRFLAFFLVTFGVVIAIFAVAKAMGFDFTWRNGFIGAVAIAAGLAVLNLLANKGTHRLPTSR